MNYFLEILITLVMLLKSIILFYKVEIFIGMYLLDLYK